MIETIIHKEISASFIRHLICHRPVYTVTCFRCVWLYQTGDRSDRSYLLFCILRSLMFL